MKLQLLSALLFSLMLAGCAADGTRGMVRVCDSSGCSERYPEAAADAVADDAGVDGPGERLQRLRELAERDAAAAYDLALRYFRGDGVEQDSASALHWMRAAAEHGNLEAQKALGRLYLMGFEEMGADPREAQLWLSIAAARGDTESRALLAEAVQARRNEAVLFEWQQRQRKLHLARWKHLYPYHWHWHDGRWYRHPPSR
jgi:TPR repeat protein